MQEFPAAARLTLSRAASSGSRAITTISQRVDLVRHFALFSDLSSAECTHILSIARENIFSRREKLFLEGYPVQHIVLLTCHGSAAAWRTALSAGRVSAVAGQPTARGCRSGATAPRSSFAVRRTSSALCAHDPLPGRGGVGASDRDRSGTSLLRIPEAAPAPE